MVSLWGTSSPSSSDSLLTLSIDDWSLLLSLRLLKLSLLLLSLNLASSYFSLSSCFSFASNYRFM